MFKNIIFANPEFFWLLLLFATNATLVLVLE